jgi:hypothetical protein
MPYSSLSSSIHIPRVPLSNRILPLYPGFTSSTHASLSISPSPFPFYLLSCLDFPHLPFSPNPFYTHPNYHLVASPRVFSSHSLVPRRNPVLFSQFPTSSFYSAFLPYPVPLPSSRLFRSPIDPVLVTYCLVFYPVSFLFLGPVWLFQLPSFFPLP